MRLRILPALLMVLAAAVGVLFPPPMHAQQSATSQYVNLTWSFRNSHPNIIYLQLYAQYNKGHIWPAPDKYWVLKDSEAHSAKIKCWEGEKICYGAWTTGRDEWGVGRGNKRSCKGCCITCSAGNHGTKNLAP
ncbi:MAG: hypothetical protein JNJ89_09750 [Rubrivivax sp.]|nr:hypothetical protein [Rubrivivax sp.]